MGGYRVGFGGVSWKKSYEAHMKNRLAILQPLILPVSEFHRIRRIKWLYREIASPTEFHWNAQCIECESIERQVIHSTFITRGCPETPWDLYQRYARLFWSRYLICWLLELLPCWRFPVPIYVLDIKKKRDEREKAWRMYLISKRTNEIQRPEGVIRTYKRIKCEGRALEGWSKSGRNLNQIKHPLADIAGAKQ